MSLEKCDAGIIMIMVFLHELFFSFGHYAFKWAKLSMPEANIILSNRNRMRHAISSETDIFMLTSNVKSTLSGAKRLLTRYYSNK